MKTLSLVLSPGLAQSLIHKVHFHTQPDSIAFTKGTPLPFSSLPGPFDLPGIGSLLNVIWNGGLQNQHEIMVCLLYDEYMISISMFVIYTYIVF